jgi:hypothetical protein
MAHEGGKSDRVLSDLFDSEDKGIIKERLSFVNDPVTMGILKYIKENNSAFFNQIERDLSKDVASRRTLFGRVLKLETCGILVSDMKKLDVYGESHIQHWVKAYSINEEHLKWISYFLSIH